MSFTSKFSTSFLILVATVLSPTVYQQKQESDAPNQVQPATIGDTKNVHVLGQLIVAGQFQPIDIDPIKQKEIECIITLRTAGEIDWDEKQAVEAAGIEFIEVPFRSPDSLTDDVFDRIRKLLKDDSKTTMLHCGSANRVGGVWLPFRVLDEGVDLDKALAEAKQIGLRTPFIEEKALDYIRRNQAPATNKIDGPTTVKPGINDSFLDPNLKIEEFLKRFEVESREIYSSRENIVAAVELKPGEIVADIGSGTGLFTRMFASVVGDQGWVYAVDVSPRLVEHVANEASRQKTGNVTAVLCAQESINLPPNSMDVAFVCDTYHHFEYPSSTLASIYRALRPGGRLIVIDFERIKGVSREWIFGHVRAGKEVFAEIQDAGFVLVDEKKIEGLSENYFLKFKKK